MPALTLKARTERFVEDLAVQAEGAFSASVKKTGSSKALTFIPIIPLIGGLAACGGGGGVESPPVVTVPVTQSVSVPVASTRSLFNDVKIIADPVSYYAHATGSGDNALQFVIPVNINDDGYTDFIVNYWEMLPHHLQNTLITTPVEDLIVAYVSDSQGNYHIANEQVFGTSYPALGSASRKYDLGDLNGDGRVDIAYATNNEDGRSGEQGAGHQSGAASPVVLLSGPNGTYDIVTLPGASWHHSVDIVGNMVTFAGYGPENVFQAFEYRNGGFVNITNEFPVQPSTVDGKIEAGQWANAMRFVDNKTLVASVDTADGAGIGLMVKTDAGWQKIDDYMIPIVRQQEFISWNGERTITNIRQFGDLQLLTGAFDEILVSNTAPDGSGRTVIIAKVSGSTTESGVIDPNILYNQNDMKPTNTLMFFYIQNGELVPATEINIINEQRNVNYNFFSYTDVNNDNLLDIVVEPITSEQNFDNPIVYLNRGGTFEYFDTSSFPDYTYDQQVTGYFYDTNTDGYMDQILFPLNTSSGFSDIQIYTANWNPFG